MGAIRSLESTGAREWQGDESTIRPLSRAQYAEQKLELKVWPKMQAMYDCIDIGVRKILIRSNNGAGKSYFLASIIVQDMAKYPDINIVCTGANASALNKTLWRYTRKLAKKAGVDTKDFHQDNWSIGENRRTLAIAPSKVEAGQGFHAERVVVMIDEATGMDTDKITALLSNATSANSLCIFTYNPINPDAAVFELEQNAVPFEQLLNEDGTLNEIETKKFTATGQWLSIGLSAFEHPNVISGFEDIPGAVTRSFVETILQIESVPCSPFYPQAIKLPWKEGTPDYAWMPTPSALARVCGEWSAEQSVGFISGSVVVNSWKVEGRAGIRSAGADIGGGGEDPSVWTHFRGNKQIDFQQIKTSELGIVAAQIDKYCIDNEIDVLAIDDTGVGHGVTDRLQELKPKYKIIPVHFGSEPKNFPEVALRNPANARCEMYLLLEKEMRSLHLAILYDKELQRELCAHKITEHRQSKKIRLEDKMLIKKRIGRSPNKADATALAVYGRRMLDYYNRPMLY